MFAGCSIVDDHGDSDTGISPETLNDNLLNYKIVDLRSVIDYEENHIKGAYNIPIEELSASNLESYSLIKDDDIVLYANSDFSPMRAKKLLDAMEYSNVKILNGGMTHWLEDRFEVEEGKSNFEKVTAVKISSLVVLDNEFDFGLIKKEGGVVEKQFVVKNNGEQTVEIIQMSTSCGCTTADISIEEIKSGEESILTVIFDPNFHEEPDGVFSRTVFLETSEGIELQVKINVEIE